MLTIHKQMTIMTCPFNTGVTRDRTRHHLFNLEFENISYLFFSHDIFLSLAFAEDTYTQKTNKYKFLLGISLA